MSLGHSVKLKENWKTGDHVSARWLNTVSRFINSVGGSVTNGVLLFDGQRASLTCYGKPHPFAAVGGVEKVTIAAGYVHIDGRGGPTLVAKQDLTITGDGFACLRVSRTDPSVVADYVYMATTPNCADPSYWWRIICSVSKTDDIVTVTAQHQFSNVELGA